ncbi:MAG: tRNA preQ1(34) S-adenosylmethionine ribosyltransferase-isomerase QueA [Treponema sp.]|jgi:S-adenosylmethionine:tRNA ribosyltransferase-isomerase|nr:tRNA preQ1(34) S-adenosylmethionine ribosyltransferase-isomerase QueA [Treponema sp.]
MKTGDFFFELPENLIAQYPPEKRGQSRLMTLNRITGSITHEKIMQLPDILCSDSFLGRHEKKPLLVFNDTKVRKARITGKHEQTGAEAEFLLLENKKDGILWKVMAKRVRRKKEGSVYVFFANDGTQTAKATAAGFEGEYLLLEFDRSVDDAWLEKYGHVPLPPYIKRKDVPADAERYQTIYAKQTGSAASPTAGLHFTQELMDALCACGIESAFVTLHVGLGTFLPVRSKNVEDHVMHEEIFNIDESNAVKIETAKNEGRKIIAVGTTSVRTLESAFSQNGIKRGWQSTSIFIYPGYRFKAVDALFTNFHTPYSTLLMLVSAFAGSGLILESYAEAVRQGYRFFSYGDAMLIY